MASNVSVEHMHNLVKGPFGQLAPNLKPTGSQFSFALFGITGTLAI